MTKKEVTSFPRRFWLGLCLLAMPAASVPAAEAYVTPTLVVTQEYIDNLRVQPQRQIKTWITSVRPAVDFGYRLENFEIQGSARLNGLFYYSASQLNTIERFFDLSSRYRTERNIWNLKGGYSVESSLFTEIATTGNVDAVVNRARWNLNPSWSFFLNEQQRLDLGYSYNNVDYDGDSLVTRLFDFDTHQIRLGFSHQLTPRNELTGRVFLSRFNSDQDDGRSDLLQFEAGWLYHFSEIMTGAITIGHVLVSTDFNRGGLQQHEGDNDFTATAFLQRKAERNGFRLALLRELRPSGSGGVRDRKEVNLRVYHELTRRWSVWLVARGLTNDSISQVRSSKRKFVSVSPRLRWNWTPKLGVELGYQYTWARQNRQAGADANSISFRVTYAMNPFTW